MLNGDPTNINKLTIEMAEDLLLYPRYTLPPNTNSIHSEVVYAWAWNEEAWDIWNVVSVLVVPTSLPYAAGLTPC